MLFKETSKMQVFPCPLDAYTCYMIHSLEAILVLLKRNKQINIDLKVLKFALKQVM